MVRIMDQTIFAGRLKELRKKKGMSQEQLADAVGLSVQAVSKWECALSYPDITLLPVLSRLFGVSVDALLCGGSGGEMPLDCSPAASLPFEDDGVLRIVQFRGRTLLQRDTYSPETEISLALDGAENVRIEVWGSVNIKGDVNGDVLSNVSVTCGDVSGDIMANGAVTCGDVSGDITANGGVICGEVGGDVTAEGGVTCGNVGGELKANGGVSCQTVKGDIEASGDVHVNGGLKSCGDIEGSLILHLGASGLLELRCGLISGDVKAVRTAGEADGASARAADCYVSCGDVEGSVDAANRVTCGDVEGNVISQGDVNCKNVEGNVSAELGVICGNVEGDVAARGHITCDSN